MIENSIHRYHYHLFFIPHHHQSRIHLDPPHQGCSTHNQIRIAEHLNLADFWIKYRFIDKSISIYGLTSSIWTWPEIYAFDLVRSQHIQWSWKNGFTKNSVLIPSLYYLPPVILRFTRIRIQYKKFQEQKLKTELIIVFNFFN